jgi:imidazolonepropionase-like amidohydrolase
MFRPAALSLTVAMSLAGAGVHAQSDAPPSRVLIEDVRIFDGTSDSLTPSRNVLVEGNTIATISEDAIEADGATVIDGGGRTMIPGLVDAHTHIAMQNISVPTMVSSNVDYIAVVAAYAAEEMLMLGFTTARDLGGPVHGVKRAIDEGLIPGPRIYPSGPTISQTSGHGDFRSPNEIPAESGVLTPLERMGATAIADGVPEMRKRAREALRAGATQLKVMAGGGVSSDFDPLDVREFSLEEIAAAVDAAEAWNTYVTVHAYTTDAVRNAIEAGVRSIDHGQLIDAETAQLMAERGIWWSLQPFLDDEDAIPFPEGSPNRAKQLEVTEGTEDAYALAKEYGIKTAFGTDTLFSPALAKRRGAQLAKLARWYEPWEVLKMATHDNYEMIKMVGPRDPYPGENGVIAEGALADLILVDGNPLEDIELVADPGETFDLIMKDGVIYKNTLD